ncbi:hypothetical protein HJG43_03295 [Kineosporiaceae bacterium SCSIO 59966]|nr:hypothetical protein HJG43_03295 [Kineosporiaceae bacterium SCSIO 59966]
MLQFFDDGQEMPSMEVLVQLAPFDAPDVAFTFQNGRGAIDVRVEEVASMAWAGNVAPVVPVGFGPLGILAASFASAADRATSTWSAEISLHNRGYLIMQLQRSPRPADLTRLRARLA